MHHRTEGLHRWPRHRSQSLIISHPRPRRKRGVRVRGDRPSSGKNCIPSEGRSVANICWHCKTIQCVWRLGTYQWLRTAVDPLSLSSQSHQQRNCEQSHLHLSTTERDLVFEPNTTRAFHVRTLVHLQPSRVGNGKAVGILSKQSGEDDRVCSNLLPRAWISHQADAQRLLL